MINHNLNIVISSRPLCVVYYGYIHTRGTSNAVLGRWHAASQRIADVSWAEEDITTKKQNIEILLELWKCVREPWNEQMLLEKC